MSIPSPIAQARPSWAVLISFGAAIVVTRFSEQQFFSGSDVNMKGFLVHTMIGAACLGAQAAILGATDMNMAQRLKQLLTGRGRTTASHDM